MSLHVVIDSRKLGDGGIGVYIETLVDGLIEITAESELLITLLLAPERSTEVEQTLARWKPRVRVAEERSGKYSLAELFLLAPRQRALLRTADIFHSPHYTLPYFLSIPSVVTIHDVIHLSYPDSVLHRPIASMLIRSALGRANQVITVSESSRAEIERYFPASARSIEVVPNAIRRGATEPSAAEVEVTLASHQLSKPYCLFVGTARPHKGLRELIEAWSRVHPLYPDLKLVCVGTALTNAMTKAVRRFGLEESVVTIGSPDTRQLSALYAGASGVIIPSLEEGFGLVALEAMHLGVPVVATPVPSLCELCGEDAWYSEDFSAPELSRAILQMLDGGEEREMRIRRGRRRASSFTRQRLAEDTLEIYRRLSPSQQSQQLDEQDIQANTRRVAR